jgi:hypothetical protein
MMEMLVEIALEDRDHCRDIDLKIRGHHEYLKQAREKLAATTHEEDRYRLGPSGYELFTRGAKYYATAIKTTLFRLNIDQEVKRRHLLDQRKAELNGAI